MLARERFRERSFLREARGGIERSVDRALLIPQLSPPAKSNPHLLINAAIGASATTLPLGRPLTTRIFQRNWADVPYGERIGNRESLDSTTTDGRLLCNTRPRVIRWPRPSSWDRIRVVRAVVQPRSLLPRVVVSSWWEPPPRKRVTSLPPRAG